jgi:hypothetical protein
MPNVSNKHLKSYFSLKKPKVCAHSTFTKTYSLILQLLVLGSYIHILWAVNRPK